MNLKNARKQKGLTQQQLADIAKVHRHTIRNAETKTVKLETMIHLKKTLRLLPLLLCFTASAQKKVVFDATVGMTASLQPAGIIRAYVTNGSTEAGLGFMYPAAITAHLGHRMGNITPYIGLGSEAWMVGLKWHVYNAIAVDASITGRNFRLTFGYSLF